MFYDDSWLESKGQECFVAAMGPLIVGTLKSSTVLQSTPEPDAPAAYHLSASRPSHLLVTHSFEFLDRMVSAIFSPFH